MRAAAHAISAFSDSPLARVADRLPCATTRARSAVGLSAMAASAWLRVRAPLLRQRPDGFCLRALAALRCGSLRARARPLPPRLPVPHAPMSAARCSASARRCPSFLLQARFADLRTCSAGAVPLVPRVASAAVRASSLLGLNLADRYDARVLGHLRGLPRRWSPHRLDPCLRRSGNPPRFAVPPAPSGTYRPRTVRLRSMRAISTAFSASAELQRPLRIDLHWRICRAIQNVLSTLQELIFCVHLLDGARGVVADKVLRITTTSLGCVTAK